eukprot:4478945-Pleurochrysis_carterae.AAC.1
MPQYFHHTRAYARVRAQPPPRPFRTTTRCATCMPARVTPSRTRDHATLSARLRVRTCECGITRRSVRTQPSTHAPTHRLVQAHIQASSVFVDSQRTRASFHCSVRIFRLTHVRVCSQACAQSIHRPAL